MVVVVELLPGGVFVLRRSSERLNNPSPRVDRLPSRPSGIGQGEVARDLEWAPHAASDTIYGGDSIAVRFALAYSATLDTTPLTRMPIWWDKSASAPSETFEGLW